MEATLPPTPFTELLGCRLPLQQAGMGGVSTPALAAAVAAEGGLGMIAATGLGPEEVARQLHEATAAALSDRIGVSFLVPFLDRTAFEAAASLAPLVECFYGDPDPDLVATAHRRGARVAWQVGSREEAVAAQGAGCDVIVLQGVEAGGHVRGTSALLPLLAETRNDVDVPLVAAGGIGSGAAVASALVTGADAVRIGTRLLATTEADVHPRYGDALVRSGAEDTVVTEAFSLGWPGAPHRVLRTCVEASEAPPQQRSPLPPTRGFAGDVGAAALYAGTSVSAVQGIAPAATVIRELVREAASTLPTGPAGDRARP